MKNLLDSFEEILKKKGVKYHKFNTKPIIIFSIKGKNSKLNCIVHDFAQSNTLVFLSEYPVKIQPMKRKAVSELLHRINFGLLIGNFEMNYDLGEVSFKTTYSSDDTIMTDKDFHKLFTLNIAIMDSNIKKINSLLYCDVTPKDALNNKNLVRYKFLVN